MDIHNITITIEEYESFKDDRDWRQALEMGGVDNWEHYYESLRDAGYLDEE